VESILGQSYPHLRLVVVNDGGAPPWSALAGIDDPRLVAFDLAGNHGRYFADAVVLEATPDPLFLVQDADDWSEPDRVERLVARLRAEEADVVYSAVWRCHAEDPSTRWVRGYDDLLAPLDAEFLHRGCYPAALYRVEALRRIGGPWAGFRIGYDSLLVNLLRMTAEVAFEERPLSTYRMRPDSLTTSPETGFDSRERERVWAVLEARYQEARALYEDHRAGAFRRDTLAELIRQRVGRGREPDEASALRREVDRLRDVLGVSPGPPVPRRGVEGAGVTVEDAASRPLDALLADPRIPWSDWSVSPSLARALGEHVARRRPGRVLELGSGVSTLVLAWAAARAGGATRVTALEHDPVHVEGTRDLLDAFGLADRVELRYAPVGGGPEGPWYDAPLDGLFDFVFVDGPPLRVGRGAVVPRLHEQLADGWTLWLKDGHREHERRCVAEWAARYPLRRELRETDSRGLWVLSAAGSPAEEASRGSGTRVVSDAAAPLVSCLMPTRDRPDFVERAVAYFLRQDYPNRELVVVDDGCEPVRHRVEGAPGVTYVRLAGDASTGSKRNVAGEVARGEVLVCWDDDDWYGPGRLSAQARPLLAGEADVSALGRSLFYQVTPGCFWRCTPRVHARMFFKQVVGGTLAWRRDARARFPDRSMAEDADLLRTLLRRGARLAPVPNGGHFVYVRHGTNSWRFAEGRYVDPRGWRRVAPPSFMPPEDLAFYRDLRSPALDPA
jgi:glycosyltransferase involved in cell wall biosynthesis